MLGIIYADERMAEVKNYLENKMDVCLIESINDIKEKLNYLLLPMSGINDSGEIKVRGKWVNIPDALWNACQSDCVLFSGKDCESFKNYPYKFKNLSENETFANENARLTAEGVLFLLIDNTVYGLKDLSVDLLGFGHCGQEIYHILKVLDVKVRVVRRHVEHESEEFISYDTWQKLPCHDCVINTSITNWMSDEWIQAWGTPPLILNIVTDLHLNESLMLKEGGRVVNAGPLPALLSSKSAAIILGKAIIEEVFHGE